MGRDMSNWAAAAAAETVAVGLSALKNDVRKTSTWLADDMMMY